MTELTEQDLTIIDAFIDFMRHKKRVGEEKIIKLEGVIRGHDIDFSGLKKLKEDVWQHVIEESGNG